MNYILVQSFVHTTLGNMFQYFLVILKYSLQNYLNIFPRYYMHIIVLVFSVFQPHNKDWWVNGNTLVNFEHRKYVTVNPPEYW